MSALLFVASVAVKSRLFSGTNCTHAQQAGFRFIPLLIEEKANVLTGSCLNQYLKKYVQQQKLKETNAS